VLQANHKANQLPNQANLVLTAAKISFSLPSHSRRANDGRSGAGSAVDDQSRAGAPAILIMIIARNS
jgi:hypothetical protein